jgi:hypothetical protein
MNVKQLIQQIRLRPGMYVGIPTLESIHLFISGFLYNNIMTGRADYVDSAFKKQFHSWVRNELEEKNGMKFTKEQNYVFYINQAFPDAEQRINAFFELCNRFFQEIDSSIEKKY